MRDWLNAFRAASFRGVAFRVDVEGLDGGRRLAITDIAYGESSIVEDFGRATGRVSLTAYVAGDAADTAALSLAAALNKKGAALLVLPMLAPRRMRVESWALRRDKRSAGYVAFDIVFVEAGVAALGGAAISAGALADMMVSVQPVAQAFLTRKWAGLRKGVANAETDSAVQVFSRAAAAMVTMGGGDAMPDIVLEKHAAFANLTGDPVANTNAYAAALFEFWRVSALYLPPAPVTETIVTLLAQSGTAAADALERVAVAQALAVAAVRDEYPARREARARRTILDNAADLALALIVDEDLVEAVSSSTGQAALDLSRSPADRAGLVRVEMPRSLSALTVAHRLYGDANRAAELLARNGGALPAFMPFVIEAVSPQ